MPRLRGAKGRGHGWKSLGDRRHRVDREYRAWEGRSKQFDDLNFVAVSGVPLRSRHGFIGVLGIGHQDKKAITRDDLDLLEQFGRLASLAFENARLYSDAQSEIEERRQAEAELRQSKELHTRVLETSTDSITLFELDGTIAFASRSNETMLGWSQDEMSAATSSSSSIQTTLPTRTPSSSVMLAVVGGHDPGKVGWPEEMKRRRDGLPMAL